MSSSRLVHSKTVSDCMTAGTWGRNTASSNPKSSTRLRRAATAVSCTRDQQCGAGPCVGLSTQHTRLDAKAQQPHDHMNQRMWIVASSMRPEPVTCTACTWTQMSSPVRRSSTRPAYTAFRSSDFRGATHSPIARAQARRSGRASPPGSVSSYVRVVVGGVAGGAGSSVLR